MSDGKKLFLALVTLVALGLPSLAQERKATIAGRVTDSSKTSQPTQVQRPWASIPRRITFSCPRFWEANSRFSFSVNKESPEPQFAHGARAATFLTRTLFLSLLDPSFAFQFCGKVICDGRTRDLQSCRANCFHLSEFGSFPAGAFLPRSCHRDAGSRRRLASL